MYSQLPVKELYKLHLMKQVHETERDGVLRAEDEKKSDLEIVLLEHQLQVAWSQVNNINCRNKILIVGFLFENQNTIYFIVYFILIIIPL